MADTPKKPKKEDQYKEQLRALGIYQSAFDPAIHELAKLERELSRLEKAWRKSWPADPENPDKKVPCYSGTEYAALVSLRRDVLAHRDALGLTPKGYKRLRPEVKTPPPGGGVNPHSEMLRRLEERCREYDG